ncbi:MAG: hypothetical protein FJY73_00165 [Candidatus Eisenbacteria bacterium]|nr:hypothetical protein [Candidatus Eisenbacteria bacterium]
MAAIEIVRATRAEEIEEWSAALEAGGAGLLFSRVVWAETLAAALGASWSLHLCRIGGEIAGGALLLTEGASGRERVRRSAPYPLFSLHVLHREGVSPTRRIPQGVEVLSSLARELASVYGRPSCDASPSLVDLRALSWAGWRVEPRVGFCLPLSREGDESPPLVEAFSGEPNDPVARIALERKMGAAYAARVRSGPAATLLVLRGERRLYALVGRGAARALPASRRVAVARSLSSLPEAKGKEEILFFGDGWEEWFACEAIEPLRIVPAARVFGPGRSR